MSLETPIAFIIFNRPEVTAQVLQAIREVQPKTLLVIADGPREDPTGQEAAKVKATRRLLDQVDWNCEVRRLESDVNLGCKQRVSSGLDWAFSQSERLIILEDDCLPDPAFFGYCEQLLDRYQDDERVMMISGDNFQPSARTDASYYFSRWAHIWGWASWSRAWQHFDGDCRSWPMVKASGRLASVFDSQQEYEYWSGILDQLHAGQIDTWDFPWAYACWLQGGLTVIPEQNLVSNLGFGDGATHTTDPASWLANLPTHSIGPLRHPERIEAHRQADAYTWETIFRPPEVRRDAKARWWRRWFRKAA